VGPIGYPETMEWNYHFMLRTIPEDSRSQNMFNFSVFLTGECKMVEYTGCFTSFNVTAGDFLGLCDQKSLYKHESNFGRLWSYDRLKLRIEGYDY